MALMTLDAQKDLKLKKEDGRLEYTGKVAGVVFAIIPDLIRRPDGTLDPERVEGVKYDENDARTVLAILTILGEQVKYKRKRLLFLPEESPEVRDALTVKIHVNDLLRLTGTKNRTVARESLKNVGKIFARMELFWTEKRWNAQEKKATEHQVYTPILEERATDVDGKNVKNGQLTLTFRRKFLESCQYQIVIPASLLTISPKTNPNSHALLVKMAIHNKINRDDSNANLINADTLIRTATRLPGYNEIAETGEIRRRRNIPFIRDMDALVGPGKPLKCWKLYNETMNEITGEERTRQSNDELKKDIVEFQFQDDYPKQPPKKKTRPKKGAKPR